MFRISATLVAFAASCLLTEASRANTQIMVPSNFTVPATASAGESFTVNGRVVSGDTLSITVVGPAYLESGPAYGTNAAGVVLVAGDDGPQPVGSAVSCATIDTIEFDCGALIVSITSGDITYYGRLFLANKKDGYGKKRPPVSLTFKGSLKKLFGKDSNYKPFAFVNPTLTFTMSDTLYSDNTGGYTITNN